MQKLIVFNHVSLDGYFVDGNNEMTWARAHNSDPEWNAFVAENAKGGGTLVFGRVTYELMARYWPTPLASQHNPVVAERMNSLPKVVFSRTLDKASWNNTKLIKSDLVGTIKEMKQEPGDGMVILGSGSIVAQLAPAGLIDEYQIVVNPLVLGKGRTLFDGVNGRVPLRLFSNRAFGNGNVFLRYQPAA
jgi:dihydrofolate reductase